MAQVGFKRGRLSRFSSIAMMGLGIVTILFVSILVGFILTAIGLLMYFFNRRLERRKARLAEAGRSDLAPLIIKEKETQVVVRIPCKHCGTLNDQLKTKCESCGAPLN